MSKNNARNALLFGSCLTMSPVGKTRVVPEFRAPDLSKGDLNEAAQELISQGLIVPPAKTVATTIDPLRCPYEITPKGKSALEKLGQGAEFGLFKIIIATGGSTVIDRKETHHISNVASFEQNMITQIENAKASDQDKQAAKSKLKEFLAHPLLGTVIGAVLGATLKS